jgi:hypothetical protein
MNLEVVILIKKIANKNPTWGAPRDSWRVIETWI